jgi:hypothetical protein
MPSAEKTEQFLGNFYQIFDGRSPRIPRWFSMAASHPLTMISAVTYVMRVPIVVVNISQAEKSNARWILEVPSELEDYWRGGPKQELRRRSSQARLAGYKVRTVESGEIVDVIAQVYDLVAQGRVHEIEDNLRAMKIRRVGEPLDHAICVAVFDECETAVAFCLGTQTGNAVKTLLSGTSKRGTPRWLCFSAFVEEVSVRGGKYIVQPPPWALSEGNRIFARHLGFLPGRIRSRF